MGDGDTLLRDALEHLARGDHLDVDGARRVMDVMVEGAATPAQMGALLAALRVAGETADELAGMAMSVRDHATPVDLGVDAVDTCGTGGDGTGTFNISTAAALVAAGAGCPVAKHGGRAASSRCGSADVLEALGVAIVLPPDGVRRCVEEVGIGFLFAPAFHPALRHAAAVRKELGVRTVFNLIGPLCNPARVRRQALGVTSPALAATMASVLSRLGHTRALVFSGHGGVDELSLEGPAYCRDVSTAGVVETEIDPHALGLTPAGLDTLSGGDAPGNAARIRDVLDGRPGAARDVVVLNAAAALVAAGRAPDMAGGMAQARGSIDGGAARAALDGLARTSQKLAAGVAP